MKTALSLAGSFLGVLIVLLALTWVIQGSEFFMYKVFAPKYAAVERQVYEETPSYNQGMFQSLRNEQRQYEAASPESKAALRKIILHEVDSYPDHSKLPTDLQAFVAQLEREERTSR